MKVLGVIPARYASTRFPGKPLAVIQGKTMIQRVYEQALKAKGLDKVVVATDDSRIFDHVHSFGGAVVMTRPDHQSGTDRCAEVLEQLNQELAQAQIDSGAGIHYDGVHAHRDPFFTAVVNIQGDEPFIDPSQIEALIAVLNKQQTDIATLVKRIEQSEAIFNPNIVKVVFNTAGKALYFSRSPLPYVRQVPPEEWLSKVAFFRHLGLYAYRSAALRAVAALPPSTLEGAESLEQLRWLENGYTIGVTETTIETIGIDTPEDLAQIG